MAVLKRKQMSLHYAHTHTHKHTYTLAHALTRILALRQSQHRHTHTFSTYHNNSFTASVLPRVERHPTEPPSPHSIQPSMTLSRSSWLRQLPLITRWIALRDFRRCQASVQALHQIMCKVPEAASVLTMPQRPLHPSIHALRNILAQETSASAAACVRRSLSYLRVVGRIADPNHADSARTCGPTIRSRKRHESRARRMEIIPVAPWTC